MRVVLNEQGYVQDYAIIGEFGYPSVVVDSPSDFDDFEKNYRSYYLSEDNKLRKNDDKCAEIEDENMLGTLRSQREKDCFPYVNRGYLWYSKLTDEQKEELGVWYQTWLDVTETKVVPEKPEWLV